MVDDLIQTLLHLRKIAAGQITSAAVFTENGVPAHEHTFVFDIITAGPLRVSGSQVHFYLKTRKFKNIPILQKAVRLHSAIGASQDADRFNRGL